MTDSVECYGCGHCTHAEATPDGDCYGYCDECAEKLGAEAAEVKREWLKWHAEGKPIGIAALGEYVADDTPCF